MKVTISTQYKMFHSCFHLIHSVLGEKHVYIILDGDFSLLMASVLCHLQAYGEIRQQ